MRRPARKRSQPCTAGAGVSTIEFSIRTLWKITLSDGVVAHAVLVPARKSNLVVWYRNGVVEGAEEFSDRRLALVRSDEIRAELMRHDPRAHADARADMYLVEASNVCPR